MKFSWGLSGNEPDNKIKLTGQYFEKGSDTKKIIDIFNSIYQSNNKVTLLDFSSCTNISTTGFTILAALGPLLQEKGRQIYIESGNNIDLNNRFLVDRISPKLKKHIPFRLFNTPVTVIEALDDLIYIPELKLLKENNLDRYQEIWCRLYELCSNANEHGENNIGAVCNGICNDSYLTFTVFDFGKGISEIVNTHNKSSWSTKECIEWALDKANSTKQSLTVPRGAGFSTLINFTNKYKGQMIICTGNTYCTLKNDKKHFQTLNQNIIGTIITIRICIN